MVHVDNLIISRSFVITYVQETLKLNKEYNVFLGRPFIAATKIIIDVHKKSLLMIVLGETIHFQAHSVTNSMKKGTLS